MGPKYIYSGSGLSPLRGQVWMRARDDAARATPRHARSIPCVIMRLHMRSDTLPVRTGEDGGRGGMESGGCNVLISQGMIYFGQNYNIRLTNTKSYVLPYDSQGSGHANDDPISGKLV